MFFMYCYNLYKYIFLLISCDFQSEYRGLQSTGKMKSLQHSPAFIYWSAIYSYSDALLDVQNKIDTKNVNSRNNLISIQNNNCIVSIILWDKESRDVLQPFSFTIFQVGHSVTVFERNDRVGGLLQYGIPTMKLSKEVVQRRVKLLAAEGIEFKTNINVGKDIAAKVSPIIYRVSL